MRRVLVVDGQGGGLGSRLIGALRTTSEKEPLEIVAVGTNVLATNAMLKAGADAGATGENPVLVNAARADVIVGPMGIVLANSMLGEITPAMAAAVAASPARKVLVPFPKCAVRIAGMENISMEQAVVHAVRLVLEKEEGSDDAGE